MHGGFEKALLLEGGGFGLADLGDLVLETGRPGFEVGDVLLGGAQALLEAGAGGNQAVAEEEPGQDRPEQVAARNPNEGEPVVEGGEPGKPQNCREK